MIRVKICGLTRAADALAAAELGADALGFVFAPASRRRADPEVVARAVRGLPPFVVRVGVFLDQPAAEVEETVRSCGLHVAQLHGRETPAYVEALRVPALKAFCLSSPSDVEDVGRYPSSAGFLLDAASGGERGGTGRAFDWSWAVAAKRFGPVVLAGGLHPGNVAEAVRLVRPWAVDACSGIETSPGVKDLGKVREFIRRARRAAAEREEG